MRGLEAEFQRFKDQALGEMEPKDINGAHSIFMCGALASANRILSIIYSGLPDKRRSALLRRVERECLAYQKLISQQAKEGDECQTIDL